MLAGEIQQRIARLDEVAGWIDWILRPDVAYDEKAWRKSIVKGRAAAEVLEAVEAGWPTTTSPRPSDSRPSSWA